MTRGQSPRARDKALCVMDDPATYRHGAPIVPYTDIEDIYQRVDGAAGSAEELPGLEAFARALLDLAPTTERELAQAMITARRQFKCSPKRSALLHVLPRLGTVAALGGTGSGGVDDDDDDDGDDDHDGSGRGDVALAQLRRLLVKKAAKSQSGVLVITVLTSPYPVVNGKAQKFSCEWNCYYCPNEPGQPRSYLHDEPLVLRANQNGFDPVLQFTDRASTLAMNGHPVDKIELLVLGGTWASYPHAYQEEFVRSRLFANHSHHATTPFLNPACTMPCLLAPADERAGTRPLLCCQHVRHAQRSAAAGAALTCRGARPEREGGL